MKRGISFFTLVLAFVHFGMAQQTIKPSESGHAPVNGLQMYYEVYGEGTPLVLLHGSFMTIGPNYGMLIPELAKNNKVIAVELQGHGRTANIDREYSYPNFASDVAALLAYLKVKKANVLGYSLGGTVALQLALDYPEKVDKIVFVSSVYARDGWIPSVLGMIDGLKPEHLTDSPLKTAYNGVAPRKEDWNEFITEMIAFEHRSFDLGLENIEKLGKTILIINGDHDGVDVSHSMKLFKAFGGGEFGIMEPPSPSRFAIIPGTTHVSLMMQTDALLGVIQPFLQEKGS